MSNFTVPYTFVGGTKARAEEVNANFSAVKDELNTKVDKNTNGSVVVGTATESTHAVNKGQVETILSSTLTLKADVNLSNLDADGRKKLQYTPYSFNIGKLNSDGTADLLDYTDNTKVVFNVDSDNPLVGTLADGTKFSRTSIEDLDITSLANGTYNLFIGVSGVCIPLANTIFMQTSEPPSTSEISFSQPVLSSNGTFGSAAFACRATYDNSNAYKAFNNTGWKAETNQHAVFTIYNPNSLNMTDLSWQPAQSYGGTTQLTIYGSDDNSSWNNLTVSFSGTSTQTSQSATLSNDSFYKYYKIDAYNAEYGYTGFKNLEITGTEIVTGRKTHDVWINTSIKPFISQKYDGSDWEEFNYIPLPQTITVSSGTITSLNKYCNFNRNSYEEFITLPDMGKETSLTSQTIYTASVNGWISNGSALVQPLLIGENFTPPSSGYKFYAMKGV